MVIKTEKIFEMDLLKFKGFSVYPHDLAHVELLNDDRDNLYDVMFSSFHTNDERISEILQVVGVYETLNIIKLKINEIEQLRKKLGEIK